MKHTFHQADDHGVIPLSTPPPDPITDYLRPVQTRFNAALTALSKWALVEKARKETRGRDTNDHLLSGISLMMAVGQVGNDALERYRDAVEMLDAELEQLDCDATDPTLAHRTREDIERQRKLTITVRDGHKKVIDAVAQHVGNLASRLHKLTPVSCGTPSTKH